MCTIISILQMLDHLKQTLFKSLIMKTILTALFLVCITSIALSQDHTLNLGNYPDCVRRGGNFCSMTTDRSEMGSSDNNISFVHLKEGSTLLRIYREKLTQIEHDLILGEPITSVNINTLTFRLDHSFTFPDSIVEMTSNSKSKQIQTLEAKTYPTKITEKYIDITIIQ